MPITTKVVSSNPAHGEVHPIHYYVIMFVNDLQHVGAFLRVLWFPLPINWPPRHNWNIVESGVKHHNPLSPESGDIRVLWAHPPIFLIVKMNQKYFFLSPFRQNLAPEKEMQVGRRFSLLSEKVWGGFINAFG